MRAVSLLSELVRIPSFVDPTTNECNLAKYIERYFRNTNGRLTLTRQYISDRRWNLVAGETENPELVFVCHMDTVQPSGDKEKMLSPYESGGYLYGLGASDMKGGMAALLTAMREVGPTEKVAYVFDCDEEYYFAGAKQLLEEYRWNPKLVICPEPTDMEIVNGCRGIMEFSFDVLGKSAHAGRPSLGVNAIEQAVALVSLLKTKLAEYDNKKLGKTTVNLSRLDGGKLQESQIVTQGNAVPDIARVLLDIRPASGSLTDQVIIKTLKNIGNDCGVKLSEINTNINYPAYFSDLATSDISTDRYIGKKMRKDLGNGGFYEAALFANAWNCPAISFGPGDASSSHTPNDRVKIDDLEKLTGIFIRLLKKYC